jgi:hypothetical protein
MPHRTAIFDTSNIAHGGTGLSPLSQRCTVRRSTCSKLVTACMLISQKLRRSRNDWGPRSFSAKILCATVIHEDCDKKRREREEEWRQRVDSDVEMLL